MTKTINDRVKKLRMNWKSKGKDVLPSTRAESLEVANLIADYIYKEIPVFTAQQVFAILRDVHRFGLR